jgi:Arc/MetJ-type ribon-helix-helix transcriptional regulator
MKRTTVSLPDELSAALGREAHRRRTSQSDVVREALRSHFGLDGKTRRIGFAAVGRSTDGRTAAESDEVLAEIYEERDRRRRDRGSS